MVTPYPPLEAVLPHLKGIRKSLRGWVACCPAHGDREPSLSIGLGDEGQVLLKCFAGCSLDQIVAAMGLTVADLFPRTPTPTSSQTPKTQGTTLALVDLAQEKMLPWKYLFSLGITEDTTGGLRIPYHLPDGSLAPRCRLRTALVARKGSQWSTGKGEIVAYGLERLEEARKAGYLIIVEGESDCWTLWYHQFPALGLPGSEMASKLEESSLAGIDMLYLLREPDNAGAKCVRAIVKRLASWRWTGKVSVVSLDGAKDPSDLHKKDPKQFKTAFQQALDQAKPLCIKNAQTPASSPSDCKPSPFSLQELLNKDLPPVRWAIPDILPEGLNLLAGKPKQGKSWLALSVALAIAAGGYALGKQPVTQGQVLYLALEDNERRLQSRARQLLASMNSVPSGIEFELCWPRMDKGGLRYLEEYLEVRPQVRLVVIDTWAKVSPYLKGHSRSQYEDDYEALTPLKYLADHFHVSILVIHHLRKMAADDVLDEITGSIGVTGAVDGALILKRERGQKEATLYVTGRDIEQDQQFALVFDQITATWTLAGDVEEFRRTKERQEIMDVLVEHFPGGMTPRQIAEALDKNYHTTRSLLRKMEDGGEIRHIDGAYFAISNDITRHQCNQRNHCNQSGNSTSQSQAVDPVEHSEEHTPTSCDYVDYADYSDYADYTDDSTSPNMGTSHERPSSSGDAPLEQAPAMGLQETEVPRQNDHRENTAISAINRHQTRPLTPRPVEQANGDSALDASQKGQTATPIANNNRCPHHPHAQWIRFDPAGQAWCDKMDCWDCYRLMRIGEALGYRQLAGRTIGQGIEAWSSFVTSQGPFAIVTATQQAIDLCEASGVEVPDLSVEVQRLVSAQ